jgi:ferritin
MQLDPAVLALLNRQINAEQYAVSLYLAIGTWADAQGFEGLSAWALGESADEAAHARKFLDYTNDRATATLTAIAPRTTTSLSRSLRRYRALPATTC